ncbi:MAG: InlB B-repeat-containing protein [Bacilli bacterium]|nr:InlB B-repeat-containing protein [Bacilli bacterium]
MKTSKKKRLFLIVTCVLVIGGLIAFNWFNRSSKIERVLKTESYAYLPKAAQNYIKEVYENTGELILTEKNKKKNEPYLNPKYALYLSLSEEEQYEANLIPSVYVIDFSPSDSYKESRYPETYNISNINNESYITPMKDQGSLGLCWSFATIEQAESYLMVRNKTPYNSSSQTFSVRQMDYATSNNGIKNYENENGYRALTSGGNFYMSSMIMSNGLSLASDTYMPYNSDKSKKDLVDVLNYSNSKYELNSTIMMPYISANATNQDREAFNNIVKENIINYGGAYVGTGSPNGNCGFKNTDDTYAIVDSDNCVGASGHAMQIIGWDDNYNYSYCKSGSSHSSVNSSGACSSGTLVNGKGAWILRNSWGDDTDRKFVYLAYESYGLDIDFTTSLTSTSERNWDNNYHKNLWVNGTSDKKSNTSTFYKKINTSEKIKMVKFLSASVDGEFKVSVKSGNNTYNNIMTVQVEYPGIYTIDLSNENIVLDDSQFNVTIESTNDAYFVENSISVFTSNVEKAPQINTENMDGSTIKVNSDTNYEFIVYSSTKNIPSNEEVTYSLLKNNVDYSNYIISTANNRVAENNINTTMVLNNNIPNGTYTLRISYNNNSFDSTLIIPSIHALAGEGTENSPYLIYTEDDLNQIRFNPEAYYLLKNDITLTENWNPIGTVGNPFRGGFDGGNHKIKGLRINQNNEDAVGFFGYVDAKYSYCIPTPVYLDYREKSYIKNITFENPEVSNDGMAGILIGKLTFNPTNAPETAVNIESPTITIDNVHFIGGHVTSNTSDAGVIAANLNVIPKNSNKPYIHMNNIFSSTTISGYHSAGIVGFINDSFESGSGIMLEFDLKNFQNVGIIDQSSFDISYSDENNYSPVVGGIYGNVKILLENFIINSTFNSLKYMVKFADSHSSLYVLGSYDKKTSKNFTYKLTNGYYVSKSFTSSVTLKDIDFSSKWTDFDTYWKIETIDGIKRIPVLKNINFTYKDLPDEITLKLYEEKSLLESLNEPLQYISYNVVTNDNIINIEVIDTDDDDDYDDIVMTAKQKGQATIHVINQFDGIEKDITIKVVADKVAKPIITYYFNGKNNNETYTQQVNALESFELTKNTFTRAGFTFSGWNTIADGSGTSYDDEDTIESGIDENLRLYAQWTAKKYTLTFDANGGTGTMNDRANISLYEGNSYIIPTNKYTRTDYKFAGWNTKADGTGISFADRGSVSYEQLTSIDGVVMKLYAQWQKIKSRVTFDANGGTGSMSDLEVNTGNNQTLTLNTFTRTDYKFAGWNTKADGSGTSYTDGQTIKVDDDMTLYAQWISTKGKVSYNSNGGTGTMNDQNFTLDTQFKLNKNTFTKTDYRFSGWNTKADGSGTSYTDEEEVTFDKNIILYAIWEDSIPYTINKYSVDETNKYISKIMVNTEVNNFTSNIILGYGYGIDVDTKTINNKQLLYTGGKTRITKGLDLYREYTNIVIGDINGDGAINSADLLKIRQHLLGTNILSGAYFLSSDINYDNTINSADLLRVRQHLLGTKPIE